MNRWTGCRTNKQRDAIYLCHRWLEERLRYIKATTYFPNIFYPSCTYPNLGNIFPIKDPWKQHKTFRERTVTWSESGTHLELEGNNSTDLIIWRRKKIPEVNETLSNIFMDFKYMKLSYSCQSWKTTENIIVCRWWKMWDHLMKSSKCR